MRFPGFIGPSYTSQSVNVDCQRAVNLYVELDDLGTGKEREPGSLVSTPGKRLLLTLPETPTRGGYTTSTGEMYAVGGNKLYSVSSAWVATEIGSLDTSTGAISFADNGVSVVLVDGHSGYEFNMDTDTFSVNSDPDFPNGATTITFQDGYFLVEVPGTGRFQFSGINDNTWDALDVATNEGSPDDTVAVVSANQNVYCFGTQSLEVFYNSGDADSPWARTQGAVVDLGCAAAQSVAKLPGGGVIFLGGTNAGQGTVYMLQGYQPKRISNFAIESVIRALDYQALASSRAWSYEDGGHIFYCLNLPGADATWVYDVSTGFWHERCYRDLWTLERDRADWHCVAFGEHVVGDYEDGRIYALDQNTFTDAGTAIVRMRRAPHTAQGATRQFHSHFQLDMETGVGLSTGQGSDPQAMLRWSDDGGHTWSNERWTSVGAIGATKTRALWRRLGSTYDRVYEVSISDPVKVVLIGADVGVESGVA
jgi:hypothetical protein